MSSESKLNNAVRESLEDYFYHLDGQPPHAVYDMVINSVEKTLLDFILNRVGGNQSKTAEILGINRNTLRKKIAQYELD